MRERIWAEVGCVRHKEASAVTIGERLRKPIIDQHGERGWISSELPAGMRGRY